MTFDSIIPAIQVGECDIGASGFTITAELEQAVDFSNPYYRFYQIVLINKANAEWKTFDDIFCCNHKIGVVEGTAGSDLVQALINQGVPIDLSSYSSPEEASSALASREIHALVQDEWISRASMDEHPELTIAVIIETNDYFGFNVAEGDPLSLLPRINDGLIKLGLLHELRLGDEGWRLDLQIIAGSLLSQLMRIYFSASPANIEQAWRTCKNLLLSAGSINDLVAYTQCMIRGAGVSEVPNSIAGFGELLSYAKGGEVKTHTCRTDHGTVKITADNSYGSDKASYNWGCQDKYKKVCGLFGCKDEYDYTYAFLENVGDQEFSGTLDGGRCGIENRNLRKGQKIEWGAARKCRDPNADP